MKTLKNRKHCLENRKLIYENIGRRIENWRQKRIDAPKPKMRYWQVMRVKILSLGFYLTTGSYVFCLAFKAVVQANAPPINYYPILQYG